jgi:hypothetical protein
MSFAADGSLLVGSTSGFRSVDTNGCPRADFGGELQRQPVVGIAVHPARQDVVYAVTDAAFPRVFRSSDGGTTWEQRSTLVAMNPVTALVLDPSEPEIVYVSQATPGGGSLLHVSKDGGTSFSTITQKPGLTLLDVEPAVGDAGTARLWAVGRSATAMGIQGFSLFGAASLSGPWSSVHDVRFFGGFARDPGGALWLGDEAGGVYRSTDGGGSFTDVSPTTAVSCLDFAQGTLWGCTPGLATQNALVAWNDDGQAFGGVVTLANVTRMADCSPETDVATKCAAAWVEWQRDILMVPSGTGGSPAILPEPPEPDAGDPSTHPVPSPEASTSAVGGQSRSSGCWITRSNSAPGGGRRFPDSSLFALALGAFSLVATRRSRRATLDTRAR